LETAAEETPNTRNTACRLPDDPILPALSRLSVGAQASSYSRGRECVEEVKWRFEFSGWRMCDTQSTALLFLSYTVLEAAMAILDFLSYTVRLP
jgi:hypothetical protein